MTKGVTKHALYPVGVLKLLDPNTNTTAPRDLFNLVHTHEPYAQWALLCSIITVSPGGGLLAAFHVCNHHRRTELW